MGEMAARRPKLLVTTTTLPRWAGDTEPRFVLDLARSMADRFDITILAPASPGAAARETLDGIRVERFRYAPLPAWEALTAPGAILSNIYNKPILALLVPGLLVCQMLAMARLLRQERFDLVHCHWMIPQGLSLALLCLLVRCPPRLLTCHGGDAFTLGRWPMRLLKRFTLRRMDAVTVVSGEIAQSLKRLTAPAPHEPLHIPMGVDASLFRPPVRRAKCPERKQPGRILFAGRIAEKKGLSVLLQAMRQPNLAATGVVLTVVGDGPLRESLEAGACDLAEAGRVKFLGPLPHAALADELHKADLFCAPFVIASDGDREGMPTVLLEAASSGIPIVASDIGGCRDLIEPGKSGWLVPPGDPESLAAALTEALTAPGSAARFAREALERAKQFAWPVIGARYADALNTVLVHEGR